MQEKAGKQWTCQAAVHAGSIRLFALQGISDILNQIYSELYPREILFYHTVGGDLADRMCSCALHGKIIL